MAAKGMPNKREKSADDAVTPSKKVKKEPKEQETPKAEKKVKTEVKAEPVQSPKKEKKKKQEKEVVAPPAKKVKEEEPPIEVKSEKKQKKKDKKNKVQPATEVKAEDAYVPGALSALFGGGEKSDSAPKEDIFAKYADGDNGFVDVPTVIAEPAKKADNPEEKRTREKQRENRKKNLHAPDIVDERKRTVFVGNLPKEFTRKRLEALFADCGKIDSVRLRGTVGSKETLSKKTAFLSGKVNENIKSIVGYVKFVSVDTVPIAIKKNGTVVDDHHIRVDGCVDIKNYSRKNTIFVGNLPFEISDDDVIEWAEACVGKVDFVRVVRDRNTGYGRGVGFITFKDDASVAAALALATPVIGGNDVRLQKVMKKSEKKEMRKGDGKRIEKRKQKKLDKKNKGAKGAAAVAGGKRPHPSAASSMPVNPLLGPAAGAPAKPSKKVQKEIKKRRKMSGPKSLMK